MPRTRYRHDGASASDWLKSVGTRLRWLREIVADSQTQAARLLEIDQSTFSGYESGDRLVPTQVAVRICDVWGVTLDYLYRGKLDSHVRADVAVRLAAAHPELVLGSEEPARPSKVEAPVD